ncbi:uncharacterized protein B0P05DRAFT_529448 [Gilbertella persicaria]|uniref:uncharacterized protein n=1 Tax=Gilbertella persicaria TaxID=101096 RepID=UPI00221E8B78|nr:uncharacterized protein B0P05DRAFT_529448 [Gilbertella persicaria]KAI8090123.1 hypothetical protein B0P05DRAFT_529448 [Gilbertella persicaria]
MSTETTPRLNSTNKKYPNTPKSPLISNTTANGNRHPQAARNRLLSSKISAPRPINLPSLKREHEGTEHSNSPATGWGSNTSSPMVEKSLPEETAVSPEPTRSPSPQQQGRAWAVPETQQQQQKSTQDFPTAAEAAKKMPFVHDDREYLKYASSDPNHTSWDEMVSEDLGEFSVDYVEFDDGTKVQVGETVSPSERFTEDYDRSYYKPSNRRSSAPWSSSRSNTGRQSYPRRLSEQSVRSDHSALEPEEITAAQKNVMLTAAERAKKRRDEQEAEYAAAAERARQKAAALAAKSTHTFTILQKKTNEPDTAKPSNQDEQKWEDYVKGDKPAQSTTSNDWSSYAHRLQASTSKTRPTEYVDYNEAWSSPPAHHQRRGWTRQEELRTRRVSRNKPMKEEQVPGSIEILKPEHRSVQKTTKLSDLLKESTSPIFPIFIEKLAGKKPPNMSFMVDTDESDKDITMMNCHHAYPMISSQHYPVLVYPSSKQQGIKGIWRI